VVMPGMQGPVLLEAVRKASPSTALMLMSGYFPEESSLGPITPFLKKPFLLEELTEAVERTLARASQGEIA
jgi:DNA-binding NtrC family response regulator